MYPKLLGKEINKLKYFRVLIDLELIPSISNNPVSTWYNWLYWHGSANLATGLTESGVTNTQQPLSCFIHPYLESSEQPMIFLLSHPF